MRQKYKIKMALLLAALLLLGGCDTVPQTKTLILAEEEGTEAEPADAGEQAYTVHKIYSREIDRGLTWAPGVYLDGEHSFRYWTWRYASELSDSAHSLEGEWDQLPEEVEEREAHSIGKPEEEVIPMETTLDYRYGFHEERVLPLETDFPESLHLLQDTVTLGRLEGGGIDAVSPDGRYAVYIDYTQTHTGARLYLLNMETGEATLLLDGDVEGCSGEHYRILTAWSPDSQVLCYGFCMREISEERARENEKSLLNFLRLSDWESTNISVIGWEDEIKMGEMTDLQLYGDWRDGKTRAVLVYKLASEKQKAEEAPFYVRFIFADEGNAKGGRMGWPKPWEIMDDTAYGKLPVHLDAERDRVYIAQEGGISVYDETGNFLEQVYLGRESQILDFLVLDDGDTFITAEWPGGEPPADICLYQRQGDSFVRRTLYVDCGYVYRMEYDSDHGRLLIDASDTTNIQDLPFYTWKGIVLEFER